MNKQCCSCEQVFTKLKEDNYCPNCYSGNWVYGYIDEGGK
jgi:Zn finger protein HypA/HybF involved in hydrogenase expression